jgi:hypothetical protein
MLLIPRDGEAVFRVRRSYEYTFDESFFPEIRLMGSFRPVMTDFKKIPGTIYGAAGPDPEIPEILSLS